MKKCIILGLQLCVFAFVGEVHSQTFKQSGTVITKQNPRKGITRDVPYNIINNGGVITKKSSTRNTKLADPFLTCFPEKVINKDEWNAQASKMLKKKTTKGTYAKKTALLSTTKYNEEERQFENRNSRSNAETIPNFGNSGDLNRTAVINGAFNVKVANVPEVPKKTLEIIREDNGTIDLAIPIVLSNDRIQTLVGTGIIGDGPNGSKGTGTGDHDYFSIDLNGGDILKLTITATDPDNLIFPSIDVLVPDDSGFGDVSLLGVAGVRPFFQNFPDKEPEFVQSTDTKIEITYRTPGSFGGIHYIQLFDSQSVNFNYTFDFDPVTGLTKFFLTDVQDHFVSGDELGFGNEGSYEMEVTVIRSLPVEEDIFNIHLNKGDVFGAALETELVNINSFQRDPISFIGLIAPNGDVAVASESLNMAQPDESPLPLKGNANISYVAPETGDYQFLALGSAGEYKATITAMSPGLELNKGQKQFIYLDFTGEDITQREILGTEADIFEEFIGEINPEYDEIRSLSPFEDFLENWGIEKNNKNRTKLAYEITKVIAENLKADFIDSKINPNFDVVILSDFGSKLLGDKIPEILEKYNIPYSRVIIGGTIDEIGLQTIGRASTIDVGNYSLEDLAVVLLDLLSEDAANPNSLNSVPIAEGVSINALIPTAIGNIVSHEAGHFLGNFHTDNSNDTSGIMDQGGNLLNLIGILPNGSFGDSDNQDVDFVLDNFAINEFPLVAGTNHTDVNTAYGLSFFPKSKSYYKSKNADEGLLASETIKRLEKRVLADLNKRILNVETVVYPNPLRLEQASHVIFNTDSIGNYKVEIYDVSGKKRATILDETISNQQRKELVFLPQEYNLTSGIYFYKIKTPTNEISSKIIIN